MQRLALVLALALAGGGAAAGCHRARGPASPASDGVREYLKALRSNDPHDAYDLLASDVRKKISYSEFALQWKQSEAERKWQAKVLEDSLKGNPDVGERALISFSDGKLVQLEREGKTWRLESELVSRSRAKRPRDAIRMFADAIAARDVGAALNVLTQRRREGLSKQIEGFISGIAKHASGPLDEQADRAELRWDENGIRYRIVLRKEDDEWRVDDIYIRPAPKDEDTTKPGDIEGLPGDDF
ncbi:MAG TPA: hypothetical protein VMZ53_28000 [Kofleriaceae bacterium]|nr:hypothetical protein [Kofleriaceae bacterium]